MLEKKITNPFDKRIRIGNRLNKNHFEKILDKLKHELIPILFIIQTLHQEKSYYLI